MSTTTSLEAAPPRDDGIARLSSAFAGHGRRAALMPYVMGGFPDIGTSLAIGRACADAGADVVELGVPFSDPLADGRVIHGAATRALAAGATVDAVLDVAGALADRVPVVVMCYANVVLARGVERFAAALARRGVSGLIVPDLPAGESDAALAACDAEGVALVPLVAPNTPDHRAAAIGPRARGFVYAASVTGTTGERSELAGDLGSVLALVRRHTRLPVAAGFGIASPAHAAAAAAAGADGVIVGSRLVRAAAESADPARAVSAAVREIGAALEISHEASEPENPCT